MFLFRFLLLNTILLFKLNYSFVTYKSTVTIGSTKAIFRHGFKRFAESDDRGFDSVIEYAQKIDKDTKNCTSDINESNLNIDENTLHAELLSSIGIVGGTTVGAGKFQIKYYISCITLNAFDFLNREGVLALPTFASDSGMLFTYNLHIVFYPLFITLSFRVSAVFFWYIGIMGIHGHDWIINI